MTLWTRNQATNALTVKSSAILATIAAGHTQLRVHAGVVVRVRGYTSTDPNQLSQFLVGWGISVCPVVGYVVTYPLDTPGDLFPPTQRWLHWRVLYPTPSPMSSRGHEGYWIWHTASQPFDVDIKAQTLAPAGGLNVFMSWQPSEAIPAGWACSISYWFSVLSS